MLEMCDSCPFAQSGKGLHLRKSLRPGRWSEIRRGLLNGEHFFCHKTTSDDGEDDDYTPNGEELVCAGAIEFQEKHGVSSQYVRICERLHRSSGEGRR